MSVSAETAQLLETVVGGHLRSMGGTLGQIIGAPAKVDVKSCAVMSSEEVLAHLSGAAVRGTLPFEEGLSGEVVVYWPTSLAGRAADLMLGGDGTSEFSAEEHTEAARKIIQQLFAPVSAELTSLSGSKVVFGTATAEVLELSADVLDVSEAVTVLAELAIGSDLYPWAAVYPEATAAGLAALVAEHEGASPEEVGEIETVEVQPAGFGGLGGSPPAAESSGNMDLLMDLSLPVSIELGRTKMLVRDIVSLGRGSIVELDKLSGDPVDIYVNDLKVAEGEVVLVDENFGVRVTALVGTSVQNLRRSS